MVPRVQNREVGLDYFGARYFSAAQGRWTSPDPVTVTAARLRDPQQLNLYTYGRNNPLKYVDPDGARIVVFTEAQKQGHSFLWVNNANHNVLYSYGRYAGGSSNLNLRGGNPVGPGILVRIEGDAAIANFLKARHAKDPTLRGYTVNTPDEEKVFSSLQDQYDKGRALNEGERAIAGDLADDARVIDSYFAGGRNCTTIVCDALSAGGVTSLNSIMPSGLDMTLSGQGPGYFNSYGVPLGIPMSTNVQSAYFDYLSWIANSEKKKQEEQKKEKP
jgi:RHS repeat-associated protein